MNAKHKYHAVRTEVDGVAFASKAEARRYAELKMLERGGVISCLVLQPRYPLHVGGKLICTYVADFSYYEKGQVTLTVEDKKGVKTPVFKIKQKLFEVLYPEHRLLIT